MTLPTAKELKKLAAACRKAGITHFKQGDLELDIAEELPKKPRKASHASIESTQPSNIESDGWDTLTEEEKLFWSVGGTEVKVENT